MIYISNKIIDFWDFLSVKILTFFLKKSITEYLFPTRVIILHFITGIRYTIIDLKFIKIYPYTYFPIQYSQKNPLLVSYFIFKRMLQSRKHSIPYKISIKSSSILLIKYKSEAIYISHKILIRNNNFILFPNTLFRLITFCQIIPRNTSSIYKLITRFKKLSKIIISWHINLQN